MRSFTIYFSQCWAVVSAQFCVPEFSRVIAIWGMLWEPIGAETWPPPSHTASGLPPRAGCCFCLAPPDPHTPQASGLDGGVSQLLAFESSLNLECPIWKASGTSLAVQWLGLSAFTARDLSSIPGLGTKIPRATSLSKKKKEKGRLQRVSRCIVVCVWASAHVL